MKNPKIIPSEPTHPRILSEEGVDEEDQKRDVAAINKPVKLDSDEGSMTAEQLGKFNKGWMKTSRSFSDEDDEESIFAFAKNKESNSCMSNKIKLLMSEGKPQDQAVAIAYKYCDK